MGQVTIDSHDGVPLTWPHCKDLRWYRSGSFSLNDHDRQAILNHFGMKDWYFRLERVDRTSPAQLREFAEKGISLDLLDNEELLTLHQRTATQFGIVLTEDQDQELMTRWKGLMTKVGETIIARMRPNPNIT